MYSLISVRILYRYENNERNIDGFNKAKSWEGEKNAEIPAFLGVISRYEKKKKSNTSAQQLFIRAASLDTVFFYFLLLCKLRKKT